MSTSSATNTNGSGKRDHTIYTRFNAGEDTRALGKEYGLHDDKVQEIVRRYQAAEASLGEVAWADPRRLFPEGISPYNPSLLVTRKGLDIFDAMRRDEQIKASMVFKKSAVLASGWEVVSPEGQPMRWEPTQFINDQLNNLPGDFNECLTEIMTAMDYGFSVTEKVFDRITEGEFSGNIGLGSLKTRKPHDFDFSQDKHGNINPRGIWQMTPDGRLEMPPGKFVIWSHQREFSNVYGRSDLEEAYRAWWSKDSALKWLAMLLERFGIPNVFALYNPNAFSEPQVEDLKGLICDLQAATSGVIPRQNKDDFEFWTPELAGNTQRAFIPALEQYDLMMARALLMPGLLGMTPERRAGSFARARVVFDVFILIVKQTQRALAQRVVNDQIIKPLTALNYATDDHPIFRFMPITDETKVKLLEEWREQVGVGTVTPRKIDERTIRRSLDMALADENAEPMDLPPRPSDRPPSDGEDPDGEDPDDDETDFATYITRNAKALQKMLDDAEAKAVGEVAGIIATQRDRLVNRVAKGELTNANIRQVKFPITKLVTGIMNRHLQPILKAGRKTIGDVKKLQDEPGFQPSAAIAYVRNRAGLTGADLEAETLEVIRQQLMFGLKNGLPSRETAQRIVTALEPYAGSPTSATVEPANVTRIVRTTTTEAFNQGRLVEMRSPDVAPLINGVEYSAVLDSATTQVCRLLDGKTFRLNDPSLDRLSPPNHPNCRSILVPITIDQDLEDSDFITPAQVGRAQGLATPGFA